MKRLFLIFVLAFAGCTTPPANVSPAQNALNVTTESCKSITAAIKAADQAVLTNALKGQDAQNALKGLTAAQAGCVTALASIQAANAAASGVPK